MTDQTIHKSIYLKADRDTVWAYLTDPEKLAIWFHAPKSPLVQGEPYELFGADSGDRLCWGNVIAATPVSYLEYTFTVKPMGDATSTVKWTLTEVAGGTQLSLEHIGLPSNAESFGLVLALDKGWEDHMDRMRSDAHAA